MIHFLSVIVIMNHFNECNRLLHPFPLTFHDVWNPRALAHFTLSHMHTHTHNIKSFISLRGED